ncbi:hypothetical protein B0H11DRAFT_2198635 [Mycena galericulata]|nr:hypothetical protein B0H11DRAFT_2198635 [Mycena galericulata]
MPNFPAELLDIIVNDLHDDVPSLKACSLASRVFVPSARVHIFSTIYLLPPQGLDPLGLHGQKNHSQKFDALLDTSPHLAPLVKDLRIVEGVDPDALRLIGPNVGLVWHDVFPGTPWVAASARTLVSIFSRLNLTRFSLVRNYLVGGVYWETLPRRLLSAIHDVFRSPALESVRILGLHIEHPQAIISMLSDANQLKELALEHMIEPPFAPTIISPQWRPQLEHLAFTDWSETGLLFDTMVDSNMDFSRLKTLCLGGFDVNGLNNPKIRTILQQLPQSNVVETLNIWYPIYAGLGQELHVELGIASLPRLRSIRISGHLCIADLMAILTECAAHAALEDIVLEVNIDRLIHYADQWPLFCAAVRNLSPGTKLDLLLVQTNMERNIPWDRITLRRFMLSLEHRSADIGGLAAEGLLSLQAQSSYSTLASYIEPCLRL